MGVALSVEDITVQDLDRADIAEEYAMLDECGDLPTDEARTYFTHYGHRVSINLVDAAGEHVTLDADAAGLAAVATVEAEVNAALVAAGAASAELGWGFSAYAFCSCPCSPGFIVQGTGTQKTATVRLRVTQSA